MTKRRWNRCISLLMIALMSFTMAGTGITVAAAGVTTIALTVPPERLLAGSVYTDAIYANTDCVTVNSGNCTVDTIEWVDAGGNPLSDGSPFFHGNFYAVNIILKAIGADLFDPNAIVTVNGEPLDDSAYLSRYDPFYDRIALYFVFEATANHFIGTIDLVVPEAVPGHTADPYGYTHKESGVDQYTVTGAWYAYDSAAQLYLPMASTDTFQDNGAYHLQLSFTAAPGCAFEDPVIHTNNTWVHPHYLDPHHLIADFFYSYGTELALVRFTVPDPEIGQAFDNTVPITATVPSDSHYTVKGNWRDEDGHFTGTFTKGKDYFFDYTVWADDGYYFAEDVEMYANDFDFAWVSSTGKTISNAYRRSLKTQIDEVTLTRVPTAEIGKLLSAGDITLEVPADAKYEATAFWLDGSGTLLTADQTAQKGERYTLEIWITADPEYILAAPYILNINGIAHQNSGGYADDVHLIEYSFLDPIRQIEVLGAVKPVVGETPSTTTVTSADPEKYEIVNATWLNSEDHSPVTQFENGHSYMLEVTVAAKSGYEFAPNAVWKIGENRGNTPPFSVSDWMISAEYSLKTVIPEVRINNIPSVTVGQPAVTDVSAPAGAHYDADASWLVWNEKTQMYDPFSGIFEQGRVYRLLLRAWSHSGYQFKNGITAYYLDGTQNSDAAVDEDLNLVHLAIDFDPQNTKLIHKVELRIDKPITGHHSSISPIITLPQNVNYAQMADRNPDWFLGNWQNPLPYVGYFEEGVNYGTTYTLVADDGYAFAEDLVVMVNGIILPAEALADRSSKIANGFYFFDMTCQHIYENGKCIACHAADANIPQTGDNSHPTLWTSLLFISGGAILTLTAACKRRRSASN